MIMKRERTGCNTIKKYTIQTSNEKEKTKRRNTKSHIQNTIFFHFSPNLPIKTIFSKHRENSMSSWHWRMFTEQPKDKIGWKNKTYFMWFYFFCSDWKVPSNEMIFTRNLGKEKKKSLNKAQTNYFIGWLVAVVYKSGLEYHFHFLLSSPPAIMNF